MSETLWVCRAVTLARAQPVRCLSCTSGTPARSLVVHGDSVRSRCFALRESTRRATPHLRESVTPLPPVSTNPGRVTLCRPTTGVRQGDSRALALLSLPGEKCYSGPRSPLSLCRHLHDLGALWCVSHGTPDSHCLWHPRAESACTQLALRRMSGWLATRHGRSAWEQALPLGKHANLSFQTRRVYENSPS